MMNITQTAFLKRHKMEVKMKDFSIEYTGHEAMARQLLLKSGAKTAEELAIMTSYDIERAINSLYKAFECGGNWLLVRYEKLEDFNSLVTWVKR